MGLHGGQVKIVADTKRSTASHQVPIKPSLGGVKARKFLSFYGEQGKINQNHEFSRIKYGLWKKLHNAMKDHGDGGEARNRKAQVWISLDEVFKMLNLKTWKRNDILKLKMALHNFGKSMQDAWSNQSITHYMVSHYLHKIKVVFVQSDINFFDSIFCTIIYLGSQNNMATQPSGLLKEWKRHIIKQEERTFATRNTVVEQSGLTVSKKSISGFIEELSFDQGKKHPYNRRKMQDHYI